MRLSYI